MASLDSLTAGDLAAGSVGSSEVAADSLGAGDLAAGSVGSSEVANDSLTGSDIVEASLGSVGSANFAGDSALLDGFDSSEFLSTSSGGTVNGSVTLNTAAGTDLELGEATLFRNSGTDETFTMNNPGAGDRHLFVGGQITATGYINFPTISGSAPQSTDCDDASEAGRAVVRTDGTDQPLPVQGSLQAGSGSSGCALAAQTETRFHRARAACRPAVVGKRPLRVSTFP